MSALARVLQVLTGDSWASGVARSIFQPGKTDAGIAFFFVSYILIASVSGSPPSLIAPRARVRALG